MKSLCKLLAALAFFSCFYGCLASRPNPAPAPNVFYSNFDPRLAIVAEPGFRHLATVKDGTIHMGTIGEKGISLDSIIYLYGVPGAGGDAKMERGFLVTINRLPESTPAIRYSWKSDILSWIKKPLVEEKEEVLGKEHAMAVYATRGILDKKEQKKLMEQGYALPSPILVKTLARRLPNRTTFYTISYFEQIPSRLLHSEVPWQFGNAMSRQQRDFLGGFMERSQTSLVFSRDPETPFPEDKPEPAPLPPKFDGNYIKAP